METKIKTYGLIIGIVLFIALLAGLSYAYYELYTENKNAVSGTVGCFSVDYAKGNNINGDLILFDESKIINNNNITIKEGMQLTYVNAKIKEECTIDGYLNINLNVRALKEGFISGNSIGALKYVIVKYSPNTYTNPTISTLKDQTFEITKSGSITSKGELTILSENLSHTTTNGYLIIFYIDGNLASNEIASNTESNFSATISGVATQGNAPKPPPSASTLITDLYNNSTKIDVENNNTTYKYDTTNNLMQDTAGNIRYYGASPNNYIYFNCETYPSTNCELWRIIGVFDGKVKLIRNEIIGTYSWDTSDASVNEGKGVNEWSQADLMKLLNPGHDSESIGGSLYYNSSSGTCYSGQSNATKSCDFTTTGIKNDITRNMIASVLWNTGAQNNSVIYSNVMYEKERGMTTISSPSDGITRTTSWTGKIALPYSSDYGYATDLSKCSQTLNNYDNSTDSYACRSNDWMYPIIINSVNSWGWLLTPSSGIVYCAFSVGYSGCVYNKYNIYYTYGVAPVLYLSSEQVIESGDGSQNSPYQLLTN